MKITRRQLRKLITEMMQDHRPSEWQEVEALRGVDMTAYDRQFGGERQTREPTPQEQEAHLAKRSQWEAEKAADAALDEDWLVYQLDGYMIHFSDALAAAVNEFPSIADPEEVLLRVIADSKILHLNDDTQEISY